MTLFLFLLLWKSVCLHLDCGCLCTILNRKCRFFCSKTRFPFSHKKRFLFLRRNMQLLEYGGHLFIGFNRFNLITFRNCFLLHGPYSSFVRSFWSAYHNLFVGRCSLHHERVMMCVINITDDAPVVLGYHSGYKTFYP